MSWAVRIIRYEKLVWRWDGSNDCYITRRKDKVGNYSVHRWESRKQTKLIEKFDELTTAKAYVRMLLSGKADVVL